MAIEIRPLPAPLPAGLRESLAGIGAPTLGHYLEAGAVDPEIRALVTPAKVVGRAVTVRITAPDSVLVHKVTELIAPGDAIVIDTGGDRRHAPVGGMVALAAKCGGAVCFVIDGVCTDIGEIRELGLPIFARGTSVLTTRLLGLADGAINAPVVCGGVVVNPGDVVLADDNGVLIAAPEVVAPLVARAREAEAREPATRAYLEGGGKLPARSRANGILAQLLGG
ncbi:MAG TPA: RraA family protein [Thermomicrobiales bacterium]|nr:RraA family protein [Thermomicrobiales bacterium]